MTLIIFFIVSVLLLIVKVEPFTAIGSFISICYLPGLSLFALAQKEGRLNFDHLILAFPLSLGVSCVFTSAILLLGIHIEYVVILIQIVVSMTVAYCLVDRKKKALFADLDINKHELLFLFLAMVITLLLSIPLLFGVNGTGISGHTFHHSLFVTQILNGIFPPTNPGLGGTIIGYYWGFHGLIAALTARTHIHPIQTIYILNVISLYFVFCISYSFARAFKLSGVYCYILPLAVVGLMRSDAGILILMKLISGKLLSFENMISSPIESSEVLETWISGLSWIDTRLFMQRKFYHISGMPLAITLCLAYLRILLFLLQTKISNKTIYSVALALIVFACFLNYPPLAIYLLLHAPLWAFYVFLSTGGQFKIKLRESLRIILPYIIAVAAVTPYLLYVIASRNASSGSQGAILSFEFYDQSIKNMIVFLVPLPIIVYGAYIMFKELRFSGESFFLFGSTLLCLTLTIFTRWPFDNSYKYNYILILFFAIFFVFGISRLISFLVSRWLKRAITAMIILFLSLTPFILEAAHIVSSFSSDYIFSFSGRHVLYPRDKKNNEAYIWIRENTPANTLIMLSYIETNWPCCALNSNYEAAALSERNLYAIKDTDYTISNPEYQKRIYFRAQLFENPADPQVIDFFASMNTPIYLLVEENLPEDRFFVEDRFKPFPEYPGELFELVFSNDVQKVYLIRNEKL